MPKAPSSKGFADLILVEEIDTPNAGTRPTCRRTRSRLVRPPGLAIWDHRLAKVGPGRLNGVEGVNGPVLVGVDVDVAVRSPECRIAGSRRGNAGPGSAGPEQVGRSRETKVHLAVCCSCLPQ